MESSAAQHNSYGATCAFSVFPSATCSTSPYDPGTQSSGSLHTHREVCLSALVCTCVSCPVGKQSSSSRALSHAAVTRCDTSDLQIMVRLQPYVSLSLAGRSRSYLLRSMSDCLPFSYCKSVWSLHVFFCCKTIFVLPGLRAYFIFHLLCVAVIM